MTVVLVADALVGEKGLMDTMRARQRSAALAASVQRLRNENARLRDTGRRLREDPWAIEAIARKDLGLLKPGEVLIILKDVQSAKR